MMKTSPLPRYHPHLETKNEIPEGFRLTYPKKKSVQQILQVKPAAFKKIKTFRGYMNIQYPNWSNMLIYGNNLHVLKALLNDPEIRKNVKLIYIDPPFGTGQEFKIGGGTVSFSDEEDLAYEDFEFTPEYLEFLRERLILLREILAEDGSIYVHIDYKVGHYLKIIMDEIFGSEHFVNDITRIKCNPKNFTRKGYGNFKDMILFYSKTDKFVWNDSREPFTDEDIIRLFPKVDENGRRYTTTPLHAPGETKNGPTGQPWKGIFPPKGRHWRYPPVTLEELDRKGLIEWSNTGVPRKKIYAAEFVKKGKKRQDVWEFKDPAYPEYPTEKNLEMLKTIIQASSSPNDIVMDAFCGSGTTLKAAEELGRRWIGIDNSPEAIKIAIKRMSEVKKRQKFALFDASEEKLLSKALQEISQE
jgi:adenine-specific DNA-methyltransferase